MSDKAPPPEPGDPAQESNESPGLESSLRRLRSRIAGSTTSDARETKQSEALARGVKGARSLAQSLSYKLGEDPVVVFDSYPRLREQLERGQYLGDESAPFETLWNLPWTSTVTWLLIAGGVAANRGSIDQYGNQHVHGKDHFHTGARWDAVNTDMDSVRGFGHRVAYGHSLASLPDLIASHGAVAVPAHATHLAQDFFSPHGIPLPGGRVAYELLRGNGVRPQQALKVVCTNFSGVLNLATSGIAAYQLFQLAMEYAKQEQLEKLAAEASRALDDCSYARAAKLYDRLVELDPQRVSAHMALSQALMHIPEERLHAHEHACFAVGLLADDPACTIRFAGARVSLRGLAGVQALSTIDAMRGITEDSWRRHTIELADNTVDAFAAAADALATPDIVPDQVVFPPVASAAINRYLAAACIGSCPPMDFREERLARQVEKSTDLLARTCPDQNTKLGDRPQVLAEVWRRELLPSPAATALLRSGDGDSGEA